MVVSLFMRLIGILCCASSVAVVGFLRHCAGATQQESVFHLFGQKTIDAVYRPRPRSVMSLLPDCIWALSPNE